MKIAAIATDDLRRVRLRLLEKSQRGRTDDKPLALLSLVTHQLSTSLRSVATSEKSNEIPGIGTLLAGMKLQGCTVTADTMHCQQETARFITLELGGDYLFDEKPTNAVSSNEPS